MSQVLILNLHDIGCENHCIFCTKHKYVNHKKADKIVAKELEKLNLLHYNKNINQIIISGNDPLEYYDLVNFLKEIKFKTNIPVFFQSHCNNFSDIKYLDKILSIGNIKNIQIPLYGHTSKIHDSVTRNLGSFDKVVTGIYNLKKLNFNNIQLHSLFLKQNQNYIKELFCFLLRFDYKIDFTLPCIPSLFGLYKRGVNKYIPDLNILYNYTKSNKLYDNVFFHDMPYCLLPQNIQNISFRQKGILKGYDHFRFKFLDKVKIDGEIFPKYRVLSQAKACKSCKYNNKCKGITLPYIKMGLFCPKPFK